METFIQKLARDAGKLAWKRFGKDKASYWKSDRISDVVTKADLAVNGFIIGAISRRYPSHGIISEEADAKRKDAEYVWIIDPIDGTLNFATGVPLFGVMIALARKGKVILSAISLPAEGALYFAKRGRGAYQNGTRIRCSKATDLYNATGCISSTLQKRTHRFLARMRPTSHKKSLFVSAFGSIAVAACYVASGRRDYWVSHFGFIHDYAAPSLLLTEAGCTVANLEGKPWTLADIGMVSGNPVLHRKIMRLAKGS